MALAFGLITAIIVFMVAVSWDLFKYSQRKND